MAFSDRISHAWNAFLNRDPTKSNYDYSLGLSSYNRPDRIRLTRGNERSIITTIYNRIAVDCAAITVEHVRLDDNGRYISTIDSGLNECLTVEANIDQTGRAFKQDVVMSMLDEGSVAIVPVDTTFDPTKSTSYDIKSLRAGKVVQWFPEHVRVSLYNEKEGQKQEVTIPKKMVAIVENPFYAIMNEPSSTYARLMRKLGLSDITDEQMSNSKLDLIIQLPYVIKTDARREQAEKRRKDIEMQLTGSKYGIAYTDSTEHITQLNRSLENNLMKDVEYLTDQLYSHLGITTEILNGTANEETMLNYHNRVIEPIMSAIVDEMRRKFLTKTARSQKQDIYYFRDPFKLVPVSQISEIADKFTRNEIMTSNEIRQVIGMKPSSEPNADELRNKNLNQSSEALALEGEVAPGIEGEADTESMDPQQLVEYYKQKMAELDEQDKQLDELERQLGE